MPAFPAWRRLSAIVPLTLAALLATTLAAAPEANAAVGHQAQEQAQRLPPVSVRANHGANIAIAQIGDPYVYGAAGPNAFDCSGLTMFSYGGARLHLPRTSAAQYAAVRHILKQNMMRGDLVFFHSGGRIYHVGIFLYWNARHQAVIVHASRPGTRIHRSPVWTSSWYAGTRRPMH